MNYPNPHGPSCPWYDITEKVGPPNIKWCEETLCQWVTEPANAWSNLGYMAAGLIILYLSFKNHQDNNLKQFGPVAFIVGLTSFFFHQSNFYGSQLMDFLGMFLYLGWIIGMNLIRLQKLKVTNLKWFYLSVAAILGLLTHFMYVTEMNFQTLIPLLALGGFITEYLARNKVKINYKWFSLSVGILILGFSISFLDAKRIWCDPTQHGWFAQGHALLHWIVSFSMFTIWKHYSQNSLRQC